jgi:hypothetical protein
VLSTALMGLGRIWLQWHALLVAAWLGSGLVWCHVLRLLLLMSTGRLPLWQRGVSCSHGLLSFLFVVLLGVCSVWDFGTLWPCHAVMCCAVQR